MKIFTRTALVTLLFGLAISLAGCGDGGPVKPPDTSAKEMEESMKTMTLPKDPSKEAPPAARRQPVIRSSRRVELTTAHSVLAVDRSFLRRRGRRPQCRYCCGFFRQFRRARTISGLATALWVPTRGVLGIAQCRRGC